MARLVRMQTANLLEYFYSLSHTTQFVPTWVITSSWRRRHLTQQWCHHPSGVLGTIDRRPPTLNRTCPRWDHPRRHNQHTFQIRSQRRSQTRTRASIIIRQLIMPVATHVAFPSTNFHCPLTYRSRRIFISIQSLSRMNQMPVLATCRAPTGSRLFRCIQLLPRCMRAVLFVYYTNDTCVSLHKHGSVSLAVRNPRLRSSTAHSLHYRASIGKLTHSMHSARTVHERVASSFIIIQQHNG